jgi:putative tryptophan/tyrosine transport system substrate-binding protein
MKRREFITLLGGAATWPLAARAQQSDRVRRIAVLMNVADDDAEGQSRLTAFVQGLQELGWTDGRNARIEYRWAAGDPERIRKYVADLVALAPDVILATGTAVATPLALATRTVPIVFAQVIDPVGSGLVASLARPGGNATGFTVFEYGVTRVAVLRDFIAGLGQLGALQSAAPSFGVELTPIGVNDAGEIESAVAAFARAKNGGLIVTGSTPGLVHRELITTLAAQHRLPAVYAFRYFASVGGLVSYGPDSIEPYRRAAGYVDRILKGEKPADLPVQAPTKYELVINLKTARALGLQVPPTLLARADEVIE